MNHFLSKLKHNLQDPEILELAAVTHGFVGADLSSLCDEAALATLRRYINWKEKSSNTPCTTLSTSASIQLKNSNPDIMDSEVSPSMRMEVITMSWPSFEKEANGDCELKVTMQDFEVAKTRVRPSAMREVGCFTQ